MIKVFVSACLFGEPVRYSGTELLFGDETLRQWLDEGRAMSFCPEVASGLTVPRPPSEIRGGSGADVLEGDARVYNIESEDLTDNFIKGANLALKFVFSNKLGLVILKDGSPSCGSTYIYDGMFTGLHKNGMGVTAALFQKNGIPVFNQNQVPEAAAYLEKTAYS
jgi:uncharacterized protein YbbK (DUF523 family)